MRFICVGILAVLSACSNVSNPVNPTVTLTTELGDIVIELAVDAAPLTATNFLQLIEGGHLDDGAFYRVVYPENDKGEPPISVIQGGLQDDYDRFPSVAHESTERTGLKHLDGAVSMARGGIDTASTEFFICVGDQPGLDYGAARNPDGQGFAVFGRVIDGMDVVQKILEQDASAPTDSEYLAGQILVEPVAIQSTALNR